MNEEWKGLESKITLLYDYLLYDYLKSAVPEDDVILFIDAFDVMLLPSASKILQAWRENFNTHKIVIGAEKQCAHKSLELVYFKKEGEEAFKCVNSGTYMGTARNVKMMLEDITIDIKDKYAFNGASEMELDDQRWFMR